MTTQEEFAKRWDELRQRTATPDWDDDNAAPIPAQLWRNAMTQAGLIANHTKLGWPHAVGPCGDGSIHLNWRKGLVLFCVEVWPDELKRSSCFRDYGTTDDPSEIIAQINSVVLP